MMLEFAVLAFVVLCMGAMCVNLVPPDGPPLANTGEASVADSEADGSQEDVAEGGEPSTGTEEESGPPLKSEAEETEEVESAAVEELVEPAEVPDGYTSDVEAGLLRQRTEMLERENAQMRHAYNRMVDVAGRPTSPGQPAAKPLVAGMADEELDPQTRAVLEGQRKADGRLVQLESHIEGIKTRFTQAGEKAKLEARDQEAERIVGELIPRHKLFANDQNPEIAAIVKEDAMGCVRSGQFQPHQLGELVNHYAKRYVPLVKTKESARKKVDAAIERKEQQEKSVVSPQAASPASAGGSKEEDASAIKGKNPRRFTAMIGRERKEMESEIGK